MNTLGYLGALGATPTQATQAAATIRQYMTRLASFAPTYGAYRVAQTGLAFADSAGATYRADAATMTLTFSAAYTSAVRGAWSTIQDYAEAHGQQRMRLPTDYATVANALPELRAAMSAVEAWVRADIADAAQAEADRVAADRYPSGTAPIRLPTTYITAKPPSPAGMSTGAKVAAGAGVVAAAWLLLRKRRG